MSNLIYVRRKPVVSAGAWYTVHSQTLNNSLGSNQGYTFRSRFTTYSTAETGPFTKIRITFQPGAGGSMGIENASVGLYAGSNTNTTGTPTQLFFNTGSNSATITAGNTLVSDELTFSWTHTDDLVVVIDIDGTNGFLNCHLSSGQGGFNAAATNSYNNATGGLNNAAHTYGISLIEGFK